MADEDKDDDDDTDGRWEVLLCIHSPSVQFSVASLFPSHIFPRCLGAGELHTRLRRLSHWLLHTLHSLHPSQPPSTAAQWEDEHVSRYIACVCRLVDVTHWINQSEATAPASLHEDVSQLIWETSSGLMFRCISCSADCTNLPWPCLLPWYRHINNFGKRGDGEVAAVDFCHRQSKSRTQSPVSISHTQNGFICCQWECFSGAAVHGTLRMVLVLLWNLEITPQRVTNSELRCKWNTHLLFKILCFSSLLFFIDGINTNRQWDWRWKCPIFKNKKLRVT